MRQASEPRSVYLTPFTPEVEEELDQLVHYQLNTPTELSVAEEIERYKKQRNNGRDGIRRNTKILDQLGEQNEMNKDAIERAKGNLFWARLDYELASRALRIIEHIMEENKRNV